MKLLNTISMLVISTILLSSCGMVDVPDQTTDSDVSAETLLSESTDTEPEVQMTGDNNEKADTSERIFSTGPYGTISISLPDQWVYQLYSIDSDKSNSGSYGIWIRPADEEDGYIDLCYMQMFGVCGTGLKEETLTLAGDTARIGTYDDHKMWDFISFQGANEGVTAQNVMAEEWSEESRETVLTILDSLRFDPDKAAGAVSYFKSDSEISEVGLIADAYNITSSGATIRFRVWDSDLASGDLEYGSDYSLERLEDDHWTEMPVIFDGEWAVTAEAYIIPKDPESNGREWPVNWEWLYGALTPGDYRIGKTIMDFRGTADYDTYKVYVYFHYAGEADIESIEAMDQGTWKSPVRDSVEETLSLEKPASDSGVKAVLPVETKQKNYAELSAEDFLLGDQHWQWWSAYRDAVNRSTSLQGEMDAYNRKVLQDLLITDTGENTVCSPLNLYLALAMLAETANGDTRHQILDVLQAKDLETLQERAVALWNANTVDTPIVQSRLANSLWLRNDIKYHENTLQKLADDYHAAAYCGMMGSPEMNNALRKWTNDNTGGLLSEYAKSMELKPQTILALVSTLYYKASWVNEFPKELTETGVFHGTHGNTEVEMMHNSSGMSIYEREKFSAISLSLTDIGDMYFFLPKEDTTPEEVIKDPALFNVLHHGEGLYTGYAMVNMTIPKFYVQQKTDLMEKLNRMGITDASVPGLADFSPLTDEAGNVYLSAAEHAAMVEIDEEGVTGAAYTDLMLDGATAIEPEPVDFILDRPFCYIIQSQDSSIIFAGIINNIFE